MKYVGVDISKESLDGYNAQLGERQFSNDANRIYTIQKVDWFNYTCSHGGHWSILFTISS